jgi:hypothetical protein
MTKRLSAIYLEAVREFLEERQGISLGDDGGTGVDPRGRAGDDIERLGGSEDALVLQHGDELGQDQPISDPDGNGARSDEVIRHAHPPRARFPRLSAPEERV